MAPDRATTYVNIHGRYVTWFQWGFLMFFSGCAVSLFAGCLAFISQNLAAVCGAVLTCANCCTMIVWYIIGIVWRFDSYGRFAAGTIVPSGISEEEWEKEVKAADSIYQWRSGKYMKIYYIITWTLMGIGLTVGLVGCIAACCFTSSSANMLGGGSPDDKDTKGDYSGVP